MRSGVPALALALLLCGGLACSSGASPEESVSMEVVRPERTDGIDANVVQLIENATKMVEQDPEAFQPRAGLAMIYHANELFDLAQTTVVHVGLHQEDERFPFYYLDISQSTNKQLTSMVSSMPDLS